MLDREKNPEDNILKTRNGIKSYEKWGAVICILQLYWVLLCVTLFCDLFT